MNTKTAQLQVYAYGQMLAFNVPYSRWPWLVRKLWKGSARRSVTFPGSVRIADDFWGEDGELKVDADTASLMLHELVHVAQIRRTGTLRWYWRYWRKLSFRASEETQAEAVEAAARAVQRGATRVEPRDVRHGLDKSYGLPEDMHAGFDESILRGARALFPTMLRIAVGGATPQDLYRLIGEPE